MSFDVFIFFSNKIELSFIDLVLYFDHIPLWGKFLATILIGTIVGIGVMLLMKPHMKKTIEGVIKRKFDRFKLRNKLCLFLIFSCVAKESGLRKSRR